MYIHLVKMPTTLGIDNTKDKIKWYVTNSFTTLSFDPLLFTTNLIITTSFQEEIDKLIRQLEGDLLTGQGESNVYFGNIQVWIKGKNLVFSSVNDDKIMFEFIISEKESFYILYQLKEAHRQLFRQLYQIN